MQPILHCVRNASYRRSFRAYIAKVIDLLCLFCGSILNVIQLRGFPNIPKIVTIANWRLAQVNVRKFHNLRPSQNRCCKNPKLESCVTVAKFDDFFLCNLRRFCHPVKTFYDNGSPNSFPQISRLMVLVKYWKGANVNGRVYSDSEFSKKVTKITP